MASKPSRSSAIATGGPIWPRTSPGSSKVAKSVPHPRSLATYQRESWSTFLYLKGHGHTSQLISSQTYILWILTQVSSLCRLLLQSVQADSFETAETLFQQVFQHFGLPKDIVTEHGPQFISRVWKAFFTVSWTLGYHPQSKGQTEWKINREIPVVILS